MAQLVKNLPAVRETWVGKIPWRRAWQSTLVFLPGESLWTEEPGRLQSMGLQSPTRLIEQLSIMPFYVLILISLSVLYSVSLVQATQTAAPPPPPPPPPPPRALQTSGRYLGWYTGSMLLSLLPKAAQPHPARFRADPGPLFPRV